MMRLFELTYNSSAGTYQAHTKGLQNENLFYATNIIHFLYYHNFVPALDK